MLASSSCRDFSPEDSTPVGEETRHQTRFQPIVWINLQLVIMQRSNRLAYYNVNAVANSAEGKSHIV